jgi:hypothetical protein
LYWFADVLSVFWFGVGQGINRNSMGAGEGNPSVPIPGAANIPAENPPLMVMLDILE